jgi:uncharacterized protein
VNIVAIFGAFAGMSAGVAAAQPMDSLRKVAPELAKFVPAVPTPASFIADVAGMLSAAAHDSIDVAIRRGQGAGLGDIAVAILPSIGDYQPVEVGLALYRVWRVGRMAKIGDVQRNIGVLMLLVPKELAPNRKGQCWITTGTGSEGMITEATGGTLCRAAVIPNMIKRDYGAAVMAGVEAIESRMRGDPAIAGAASNDSVEPMSHGVLSVTEAAHAPRPSALLVVGIVLGVLGLGGAAVGGGLWWRRNHVRTCAKCGRNMQRLSEEADNAALTAAQSIEENIDSVDYDVWQCACGERTIIGYVKRFSGYSVCGACHARTEQKTQTVLREATSSASGSAENTYICNACGAMRKEHVTLPQLVASSSSSGGASSSGGSSGGSSFGGSGSSSGGGGESSY